MRAKFEVRDVSTPYEGAEELTFSAVTDKPFDPDGMSDDNSFSKWTPSGELRMVVTNPNLLGKLEIGQKFYLDFTPAES